MSGHDHALTRFRSRLRETADVPTILAELERSVQEIARSRCVYLWADATIAAGWVNPDWLPPFDPRDPLVDFALRHSGPSPVHEVTLQSPVFVELRSRGADLIVPLVSLGSFVGMLVLGPPSSESEFSADEVATLEEVAAHAAAALRVARLTQQTEASDRAWQSNAEELSIARKIQRSLLPETLPTVPGWEIEAHYRPARVVGGDLYDFIPLPGDLIGFVFGDASDKSVPAALMMATARTLLRAAAQRLVLPAQVLAQANEDLCAQIPPGMFVTCFFAILDASNGRLRYANAGQCAPYLRSSSGVTELRASGWPLGIMPVTTYVEGEVTVPPGSTMVCFSDGLIETHDTNGEMFGGPRLVDVLASSRKRGSVVEDILAAHRAFAGPEWDQEDDLTLVSMTRRDNVESMDDVTDAGPKILVDFSVSSAPDVERGAARQVLTAVECLPLSQQQRDRLFTAVAETVMNAAEHGNHNNPDLPVEIQVIRRGPAVVIRISDRGRSGTIPEPATPDLDAKLAGLQSPRGWGLFLIENMVDRVEVVTHPEGHTVELTVQFDANAEARP